MMLTKNHPFQRGLWFPLKFRARLTHELPQLPLLFASVVRQVQAMGISTCALSPDTWPQEVTALSNATVDPALLKLMFYEVREIRPAFDRLFVDDHSFALDGPSR